MPPVEVTFADPYWDELETNENCKSRLDKRVVRGYRRLLRFIRDSTDERDLRASPKHFEKLKGDRSHQYSMQIDEKWRLVFEIMPSRPKNTIHVIAVEDYHKG